jgi:hypothetical protein
MKGRIIISGVTLGVVLISFMFATNSYAKPKSERQKRAEEQRRAREEAERAAKRREMEKKIKADLQQLKEWVVYLVPTGSNPVKMAIKKDILTFTDVSIGSEYFAEKGFGGSNYSLSANDDGMGVWETMQRNDKGDIAFWRGEVKGTWMRGTIGLQLKKGKMQEFTFTTDKPAGYIEPAPKKKEVKSKKGEAAVPVKEKTAP